MRGRKAKNEAPKRKAIGYCRVSTEEQVRAGVSLEAQSARITAFAVATGRELADIVVDDGYSAKDLRRPGMQKVLDGIRAREVDAVICMKLDRLTRSIRNLAELVDLFTKDNVAIVSVSETLDTSTAAGRMMLHLLGVFAQWEREAIGERTSFALSHKRASGQVYGPTPFGYVRAGNELVLHEGQQKALRRMRTMAAGGASLRQIGAWLSNHGIDPPRGGKQWHPDSVSGILTRDVALSVEGKAKASGP